MSSKRTFSSNLKTLLPMMYCVIALFYFVLTIFLVPIRAYHVIGALIALVSFMLWITARMQLGDSFSITPKANHLVTTGLYSKFRHPVYYFSITAMIGINIFMWSFTITPLVVVLIGIELVRIRQEERVLAQAFGRKYRGYKRRTWL